MNVSLGDSHPFEVGISVRPVIERGARSKPLLAIRGGLCVLFAPAVRNCLGTTPAETTTYPCVLWCLSISVMSQRSNPSRANFKTG